jgi:hypothetical protein
VASHVPDCIRRVAGCHEDAIGFSDSGEGKDA